jgi:ubiquinone/menaquinone biosynthesis C-methylase UbiE
MTSKNVFLHFAKLKSIKSLYKIIFQSSLTYLRRELLNCNTVLDLGCGSNSSVNYCDVSFSVGVDLFDPYLQESKNKMLHNQYIKADIRKVEFQPQAFDAVIFLEVLEHLTKDDGYRLLKKMETWARKKIIITTPNGYLTQNVYDSNPFQRHVSGWTSKELEKLGFKVYGMKGWKKLRGCKGIIEHKPAFLWEIFSDITQKITYRCPKKAFQLFAIKNIRGVK